LYAVDPQTNLFPSLHVSLGVLAALSISKAAPGWACLATGAVAAVAISVCTVKQHVLIDVVGGLALAGAAHVVILRR
ncbi:MAG TPA: phosphatase PAP2 family protein, partial [Sphingomicrobium sp.]|nr:phosphatase PAP2 family protein [Sphingomicrobium sp.]